MLVSWRPLGFRSCWSNGGPGCSNLSIVRLSNRYNIESRQYQMRNIGITLRLNEEVVGVTKATDQSVVLQLKSGKQIRAPLLVYSAGRVGATTNLGLEQIGILPDERGRLKVNETFQTAVPHIYAAGDVIGFPALASTSMQQGRHA